MTVRVVSDCIQVKHLNTKGVIKLLTQGSLVQPIVYRQVAHTHTHISQPSVSLKLEHTCTSSVFIQCQNHHRTDEDLCEIPPEWHLHFVSFYISNTYMNITLNEQINIGSCLMLCSP